MKNNIILKPLLYIAKAGLKFIYCFIKLFPTKKNTVTLLSRQSDKASIDFCLLKEEFEKRKYKVKILTKKIPKSLLGKIGYGFYTIKTMYYISTSEICIVDGYSIPISVLKHKKGLVIAQIWHAMGAIKKFGYQVINKGEGSSSDVARIMQMHKNYDFVTSTSNVTKKFYEGAFGVESEKVKVLGMPRVDYLLEKDDKVKELVEKYPILKEKKNIVYVPTFRKNKTIDIQKIIDAFNKEGYNLIIRLHPLDKSNVEEKYKIGQEFNTSELLKIADYVISDYSAIAFEASALNKPLFFYIYDVNDYKENRGLNINLKEEMKSNTYSDIKDIADAIYHEKYNYEELENFRKKYVETLDTHNTQRIIDYIIELKEKKMAKNKSTLKAKLIDFSKKNVVLRKIVRQLIILRRRMIYKLRTLGIKTDSKTAIFFAFKGKSYACSPKAIYEYMLSDDKYKDFKFIWAFEDVEPHKYLENNRNTKVVKYGGKEYQKNLASAKYWIFNYRVQDQIYPKKDQVYVQCWHGTPLKKLGYDLKNTNNAMNTDSEIYEKYKTDAKKFKYILSPSKFATEKFISAWNLEKTNMTHKVIEEGYPRNDFLYNFKQEDVEKIKNDLGLPKDKKIILYAPTWRDDQHESGVGYTYKTEVDFDLLRDRLKDEYVILFRAHYLVANSFDFEKYKGFIYNVSEVDNINDLYIISDILITDYSSVFFDYASLKRPMIFYMYDFDKYKDELRGFYIDIDELPGEITKTENDLINAINKVKDFKYDEKYKKFNEKYNYLDDGNAAKRVTEKIIEM